MKIIKTIIKIVCICYIGTMLGMTAADVLAGISRESIFEAWGLVTAVTLLIEMGLTIALFAVKIEKGN